MTIETKRYMILFEGNDYPIIMSTIYSAEKFEKEKLKINVQPV